VEVVSFDGLLALLEADVVEAGEGGARDVLDGVVGHQEVLLPAHEDEVRLLQRVVVEVVAVEALAVLVERHELRLQEKKSL